MIETAERSEAVQFIGNIDIEKYTGISPNILTSEVVLTDKQMSHILEKRAYTFAQYRNKLPEIIKEPDYILVDPKHNDTALVFKKYDNSAVVVLRLATETIEKKNSILTMWEIKEPRLRRYLLTHKTIYKRS